MRCQRSERAQMSRSWWFWIRLVGLVCAMGLIIGSASRPAPAAAAGHPTWHPSAVVRLEPASACIKDTRTLRVKVDHVVELYGYSLRLTFDPQVIQVVDADPAKDGVQIALCGLFAGRSFYEAANTVDNDAGVIDYSVLLTGGRSVTGTGLLVCINLSAQGNGSSTMEFDVASGSTYLVRDPATKPPLDPDEIPVTAWQGASLAVSDRCTDVLIPLVVDR